MAEKQDCERKAFYRLIGRLRKEFPMLPMCICGDSLYTCGPFFTACGAAGCRYLVRFKEGSILSVYGEYEELRKLDGGQLSGRKIPDTRKEGGWGKAGKKKGLA